MAQNRSMVSASTWRSTPSGPGLPVAAACGAVQQPTPPAGAAWRWTLAAVTAAACSGCGYSTERPFPRRDGDGAPIRTVAVDIFESREFRRGLELQLAEALMKRIEADTPYRLATRDRADTLLSGEIKEVRQATIGRDFRGNRPRETAATLVVSFTWKDQRTGRVMVERPNFIQTVDYIRPVGEDFYDASQKGLDRLAERIVEQLESDW